MGRVVEPGKFANWIAPPVMGINRQPVDFEYVRFNARLQGLPDADDAARRAIWQVGLEDAADRPVGTYSKGMRQRAKVAGALAGYESLDNLKVLLLRAEN